MRDKNPKISPDEKNRYYRTVKFRDTGRSVCVEYDACLIDSEDIVLISCEDDTGDDGPAVVARIQALLDQVHSTLRTELAEYADYTEAHR